MKFPPFLHSHLRLTLLGTPPNRVFFVKSQAFNSAIRRNFHLSSNHFFYTADPLNKEPQNFEIISSALLIHNFCGSKFLVRHSKLKNKKVGGRICTTFI